MNFAYRVAQVLGAVWFSTAAIPTYLIGRRVGLSSSAALSISAAALLVPCGALPAWCFPSRGVPVVSLGDSSLGPRARRSPPFEPGPYLSSPLAHCRSYDLQFVLIIPAYLLAAVFLHRGPPCGASSHSRSLCAAPLLSAVGAAVFGVTRAVGELRGARRLPLPGRRRRRMGGASCSCRDRCRLGDRSGCLWDCGMLA